MPTFKKDKKGGHQELPTCQPHLCAWEGHGTDPPGSCAKAQEDRDMIHHSQHSFTEGKSCLIILVTFCDGVTTSVDKERAMDSSALL